MFRIVLYVTVQHAGMATRFYSAFARIGTFISFHRPMARFVDGMTTNQLDRNNGFTVVRVNVHVTRYAVHVCAREDF